MKWLIVLLFLQVSFGWTQSRRELSFFFETGSHVLSKNQETKINAIKKQIDYSHCWIYLHGFTDEHGSRESNLKLSEQRVETVKKLFGGAKFMRCETQHYGEDSTSHDVDSMNRRVDVIIYRYDEMFRKKPMRLRNVLFVNAEYIYLNEEAEESVSRIAEILKENPEMRIMIHGHVCCNPNQTLSVNRAIRVANTLVSMGIDQGRLEWQGHSNKQPLVKEVSDAARQRNRRVEIEVLSD